MSYGWEPLTEEQEDEILKKLEYSRGQLTADITQLREWLANQEHLPQSRLKESDTFLSSFLVGCKGSIEKAKQKLDRYYSFRGTNQIFTERTDTIYLERLIRVVGIAKLRKSKDTTAVLLLKLIDYNPENYNGVETLKSILLGFEHDLRTGAGIRGKEILVLDARNYTMAHFMRLPPLELKSMVDYLKSAHPFLPQKVFVTNLHPVLTAAVNAIISTLSAKFKQRIHLTSGSLESVFDPVDMLPSDYEGGKEKSLQGFSDVVLKKYRDDLKDVIPQLDDVVDDSKRPMKDKDYMNDFGMHGSFKTLVID